MPKLKIWYYTTINTEEDENRVFDSFPDEIQHEGKRRMIRLTKDSIESFSKDVDYGE